MNSLHTGWINCNVSRSLKPPEFLFRIQSLSSCSQKGLIEYPPHTCILIFSQDSTGSYADFWGSFSLYFLHISYPAFQISVPSAAAARSLQSCPTLRHSIDGSPPSYPVPGIPQARTLEWVPFPSPMHAHMLSRFILSDSVRPCGQQRTRLLCARDFLGKNTGEGCHPLLLSSLRSPILQLLTSSFLFVNSLPFVMVQKVSPGRHLGECDAHLMYFLSFTDNSLVLCCSGSERVASCSFSRFTVV